MARGICQSCGGGTKEGRLLCLTCTHGTISAYQGHFKRGEEPCELCRKANREYQAAWSAQHPKLKHPRKLQPCGTFAAYKRHLKMKEVPCEPCKEAAREQSKVRYERKTDRVYRSYGSSWPTSMCEECGNEFSLNRRSNARPARFCSRECFDANQRIQPDKSCEWCGNTFRARRLGGKSKTEWQKCCSNECAGLAKQEANDSWPRSKVWHFNCVWCGKLFIARQLKQVVCRDPECYRRYQSKQTAAGIMRKYYTDPQFRDQMISAAENRRVSKLGLEGITQPTHVIAWLLERDQGVCGICEKLVVDLEGPWRPSIDHVIPLSRGGLHIVENLQLAHYRCNLAKNNSMPEDKRS